MEFKRANLCFIHFLNYVKCIVNSFLIHNNNIVLNKHKRLSSQVYYVHSLKHKLATLLRKWLGTATSLRIDHGGHTDTCAVIL